MIASAWKYRRPVVLTTAETDTLVELDLAADSLDFTKCRPDGLDIGFIQNGVMLARDLIGFSTATETATVHFRLPDAAQPLTMVYGGPAIPNDPEGVGEVSSTDFRRAADGVTLDDSEVNWSLAAQTATPDADDFAQIAVGLPTPRPVMAGPIINRALVRQHTGTNATTACRVPHQRDSFFANGLWWRVFAEFDTGAPYDLTIEYSDDDGETWTEADSLENVIPVYDAQWTIAYSHALDRFCYVRNIQSGGVFHDGLAMRQGRPNEDGTITWDAVEQTVVATGTFCGDFAAEYGIDGRLWVGYGDDGTANPSTFGDCIILKNGETDGTWSAAAGFPVTAEVGSADDLFCALAPIGTGCYVIVYTWNVDEASRGYLVDAAGGIRSEGDVTELPVEATSGTGARVGRIECIGHAGHVWVAYQSSSQTIRVGHRDAAGDWQPEVELAGPRYLTDAVASPRLTATPTGLVVCWTGKRAVDIYSQLTFTNYYMAVYDEANELWHAPVPLMTQAYPDNVYEHLMPALESDPEGRFLVQFLEDDNEQFSALVDPRPIGAARPRVLHYHKSAAAGMITGANKSLMVPGDALEFDFYLVSATSGGDTNDYMGVRTTNLSQGTAGAAFHIYGDGPSVGYFAGGTHTKVTTINAGQWYRGRIVILGDGSVYNLYLDGVLVAEAIEGGGTHERYGVFGFAPHQAEVYFANFKRFAVPLRPPTGSVSTSPSRVASAAFGDLIELPDSQAATKEAFEAANPTARFIEQGGKAYARIGGTIQ